MTESPGELLKKYWRPLPDIEVRVGAQASTCISLKPPQISRTAELRANVKEGEQKD